MLIFKDKEDRQMKKSNYIGNAIVHVGTDHLDVSFDFLGGRIIADLSEAVSIIYWVYGDSDDVFIIDESYPSNIDWAKYYLSLYGLRGSALESKRAKLLRDICLDRVNNCMQSAMTQLSECG